jgi:hypothetical protein
LYRKQVENRLTIYQGQAIENKIGLRLITVNRPENRPTK